MSPFFIPVEIFRAMEFAVGPRAVEVEVVANDVSLRDIVRSKVSLSHGREVGLG